MHVYIMLELILRACRSHVCMFVTRPSFHMANYKVPGIVRAVNVCDVES